MWYYNYKKTDFDGLNSFLLDFDFKPMLESYDIEFVWSFLKDILLSAVSIFSPMVRVKSSLFPKWFTSNIRHQLNEVHSLRKKYKKHSSPSNLFRVISAECFLQLSMLDARSHYEALLVNEFATSRNPAIYHYLKSFSKSSKMPSVMYHHSTKAEDPIDKANLFNNFFHSVFTVKSNSPIPHPSYFPENSLCSISISLQDVFEVLTQLVASKAMGGDGISPAILKGAATSLLEPLHHLYTLCIQKSYFPIEWRRHYIIPIPKSGDLSQVSTHIINGAILA